MDEWFNDPKLHSALVAVLVAIGVFLMKREVKRIDEGLAHAVKRSELEQLRADMRNEHRENVGRLDGIERKIDTGITGTHQRIDRIFEKLAERE